MSKIISCILNILLTIVTIIIIIGMYYIYQLKIEKNDYANLFGYTFFEVATGSMSPTMEIGDVVIVKITKQVEQDDIIVYIDGENIITHRLIEIDDNELIAKGDANNSEDKPIQQEMVLGEVIKILPKVGIWRKIFTSSEVVGLILVLIVLFSAVFMFSSSDSKEKEEKGEKDE